VDYIVQFDKIHVRKAQGRDFCRKTRNGGTPISRKELVKLKAIQLYQYETILLRSPRLHFNQFQSFMQYAGANQIVNDPNMRPQTV
jgi:hypothetical protein